MGQFRGTVFHKNMVLYLTRIYSKVKLKKKNYSVEYWVKVHWVRTIHDMSFKSDCSIRVLNVQPVYMCVLLEY